MSDNKNDKSKQPERGSVIQSPAPPKLSVTLARNNRVAPSSSQDAPNGKENDFLNLPSASSKQRKSKQKHKSIKDGKGSSSEMGMAIDRALRERDGDDTKSLKINRKGQSLRPTKKSVKEPQNLISVVHKLNLYKRTKDYVADLEYRSFHNSTPIDEVAAKCALILLPVLTIITIWDLIAVIYFEVPYLSSLKFPGTLPVVHAIAVLCSMYAYMITVLHQDHSALLLGWISFSIIWHVFLFIIRIFFEINFATYRPEEGSHFESYESGANVRPESYKREDEYLYNENRTWLLYLQK